MRHKDVWHGTHREIAFEINRFKFSEEDKTDRWTFYLHLSPEQFPESIRDAMQTEITFLTYGSRIESLPYESWVNSLEWHCGLTFAEEIIKKDFPFKMFKYGCDYQHYWDEGKYYCLKELEIDVKACIDSLYVRCGGEVKSRDKLWKEFQERFPKTSDHRRFKFDGSPIEDSK